MDVGRIAADTFATRLLRERAKAAAEPSAAHGTGRALVAVDPIVPGERPCGRMRRPNAAFLAQLIATDRQVAQTRHRRRAEAGEAIAAYSECAAIPRHGSASTRFM